MNDQYRPLYEKLLQTLDSVETLDDIEDKKVIICVLYDVLPLAYTNHILQEALRLRNLAVAKKMLGTSL